MKKVIVTINVLLGLFGTFEAIWHFTTMDILKVLFASIIVYVAGMCAIIAVYDMYRSIQKAKRIRARKAREAHRRCFRDVDLSKNGWSRETDAVEYVEVQ